MKPTNDEAAEILLDLLDNPDLSFSPGITTAIKMGAEALKNPVSVIVPTPRMEDAEREALRKTFEAWRNGEDHFLMPELP